MMRDCVKSAFLSATQKHSFNFNTSLIFTAYINNYFKVDMRLQSAKGLYTYANTSANVERDDHLEDPIIHLDLSPNS